MKNSRNILAASIAILFVAPEVQALDNLWLGGATEPAGSGSDWNNPANWSLGEVPENTANDEDAVINSDSPFFPIITTDITPIPRDTKVGIAAGTTGRVDHRAGTYTQGGGNWTVIGSAGGTGVYNLANTAATGGTTTGFGEGSGTFNAGRRILIGDGTGSVGTLNINTSGSLILGDLQGNDDDGFRIGMDGTGVINMDGGFLQSRQTRVGGGVGSGTVNISGGTWTNDRFMMVGTGDSKAAVNQTGGTVNVGSGWFGIGYDAGTQEASYKISGGELNITPIAEVGADRAGTMEISGTAVVNKATGSDFVVGLRNAGSGTLKVTGGSLNILSSMNVGQNNNSVGDVSLTAGEITVADAVNLGVRNNAKGTMTVGGTGVLNTNTVRAGWGNEDGSLTDGQFILETGGTVNIRNSGDAFQIGDNRGTGKLTVNGGAINFTNGGNLVVGWGGTANGTVEQSGGAITTTGNVSLGGGFDTNAANPNPVQNISGDQTYNLSDGSLAARNLYIARGNAGTSTFNQTGGTVNLSGNLDVQGASTGTYNLSGGILSVNGLIDNTAGTFGFSGGRITRSTPGAIVLNGNLKTLAQAAGLTLEDDKTFQISGTFDISAGLTLDISGLLLPQYDGSGIDTGSFQLGLVASTAGMIGTFDTSKITLISDITNATFISETQGEGGQFDAENESVFWIQEKEGEVTLEYSVVPEPSTFAVLSLAGMSLAMRRRRRK